MVSSLAIPVELVKRKYGAHSRKDRETVYIEVDVMPFESLEAHGCHLDVIHHAFFWIWKFGFETKCNASAHVRYFVNSLK